MTSSTSSAAGQVSGILESITDQTLVLSIPGTEYRLHLFPGGAEQAAALSGKVGSRVCGTIHAGALRMHPASAGGRFIEPIVGHPRIVQGSVLQVDAISNRVLLNVGVPIWVQAQPAQDLAKVTRGQLMNFYVQSGAAFNAT